jgi:hypothetical protein
LQIEVGHPELPVAARRPTRPLSRGELRPAARRRSLLEPRADVAVGGEIGDGVGPPVPVAAGERACSDAGGEMHERSHEGK